MAKSKVIPIRSGAVVSHELAPLHAVHNDATQLRAALTCANEVIQETAESETAVRAAVLLARCVREFEALCDKLDRAILDVGAPQVATNG